MEVSITIIRSNSQAIKRTMLLHCRAKSWKQQINSLYRKTRARGINSLPPTGKAYTEQLNRFIGVLLARSIRQTSLKIQMARNGSLSTAEESITSATEGVGEPAALTRLLKPYSNQQGYLRVDIGDGHRRTYLVHQLVALSFIPNDNPIEKDTVDHIDMDKTNNRVENLRWLVPCG